MVIRGKIRGIIEPTLEKAVLEVNKFRENLRLIKQAYEATEEDLARSFGVKQPVIHWWLSGKRNPDYLNYERARQWANELRRQSASY